MASIVEMPRPRSSFGPNFAYGVIDETRIQVSPLVWTLDTRVHSVLALENVAR